MMMKNHLSYYTIKPQKTPKNVDVLVSKVSANNWSATSENIIKRFQNTDVTSAVSSDKKKRNEIKKYFS